MPNRPHATTEFALIAKHFAPLAAGFAGAYGLVDDVAVIAPAPGHELVAKTDAIVAGIHFFADDPADLVAKKALRVNLSDLAAKGAVPRAYLLDLIVPRDVEESWIAAFARGLAADQAEYRIHLIGGDTDMTPGPATIAITALGEIATGRVIRRGGAAIGDGVYVTGSIGDGALGLKAVRGELPELEPRAAGFLIDRYRLPRPRVALGPHLVGIVSASLDVSDGLVADLRHLCEVSRVAAIVAAARVPLSPAARAAIRDDGDRLKAALTGGDDYEILFTAPASAAPAIAALSARLGVAVTAIGEIVPRTPDGGDVVVLDASGNAVPLDREGWQHF